MTKFNDIKGVVFDLDGVITDTARFHAQAWHALATELGVKWDDGLASGLKGLSRMDSLELILKHGGIEAKYNDEEKQRYATEKNTNYKHLIQQLTPDDIYPGMKEFLDELKDGGYKMSLASASKNAPTILEHLELTDYFKKIVDPASLHRGKPDPEIFIKAAELIDLKPEECLGLEDAVAGIAGINAAHETSVGIGDPDVLTEADMVFSNTKNVTLENIKSNMEK